MFRGGSSQTRRRADAQTRRRAHARRARGRRPGRYVRIRDALVPIRVARIARIARGARVARVQGRNRAGNRMRIRGHAMGDRDELTVREEVSAMVEATVAASVVVVAAEEEKVAKAASVRATTSAAATVGFPTTTLTTTLTAAAAASSSTAPAGPPSCRLGGCRNRCNRCRTRTPRKRQPAVVRFRREGVPYAPRKNRPRRRPRTCRCARDPSTPRRRVCPAGTSRSTAPAAPRTARAARKACLDRTGCRASTGRAARPSPGRGRRATTPRRRPNNRLYHCRHCSLRSRPCHWARCMPSSGVAATAAVAAAAGAVAATAAAERSRSSRPRLWVSCRGTCSRSCEVRGAPTQKT